MKDIIKDQLSKLQNLIDWLNNYKQGCHQLYLELVEKRRELKKILFSIEDNPAVVIYGASQCGKSHLVSSLLSTKSEPLKVIDPFTNESYDFLTHLNPQGDGEATGLITRFSISKVSELEGFPVRVKLMSVKDIILLLCEGNYNHVTKRIPLVEEIVEKQLSSVEQNAVDVRQTYITEDDIWDIKDYFSEYVSKDMTTIIDSKSINYFMRVANVIEHLPIDQWSNAFSILWNNEENFTSLFNSYIEHYRKINFVSDVYIQYKELLNNNIEGAGTLLNVQWLDHLDKSNLNIPISYKMGSKIETAEFNKAYLSALASEIVLQVRDSLVESKQFLSRVDILDFPGARGRENANEITAENLPAVLRRGKVAYYFNRYSVNKKINSLLFCFEPNNFDAKPMGNRLEKWIKDTLGKTKEEREEYLKQSLISPLFFIVTKFNKILELSPADRPDNKMSLTGRWEKLFDDHLYKSIITTDSSWFNDWTNSNKYFNNIYLLRDYRYSGNIFSKQGEKEDSEIKPSNYEDFRICLKNSFENFEFIKKHFKDSTEAWNESATVNHDGSELIIKNLNIAAENITEARNAKYNRDVESIKESAIEFINRFYHDEKSDNNFQIAKQKAGEIQLDLDRAYGKDAYFFGKLIKHFLVSEAEVYKIYHSELENDSIKSQIDNSQFFYIRMKAPSMSPSYTFDENLKILSEAYEMTPESCKKYFEQRQLNLEDLFSGVDDGIKNISQMLAERLEKYWYNIKLNNSNFKEFNNILEEISISNIIDMIKALYSKLNITEKVAYAIRRYVDKFGINVDIIEEMVADISAEILNKFLLSVGYDYLSQSDIENLHNVNDKQSLGLDFSYIDNEKLHITPLYIAEMFEAMDDLDNIRNNFKETLKYIPGVVSRKKWSEYLKIGFIQTQDIPTYDIKANKELGEIKLSYESM